LSRRFDIISDKVAVCVESDEREAAECHLKHLKPDYPSHKLELNHRPNNFDPMLLAEE
jgi:hypothetical protein